MTMQLLADCLMLAGVLAAVTGLALLFHLRFGLDTAFCFIAAIMGIIVALAVFGLLGLLFAGWCLVCAFALGCLVWHLRVLARQKAVLAFFTAPATVLFLLSAALFAGLYHAMVCYIPDEYSHWALVTKEVLRLDHLPDARSIVTYRDYPPGAALFLYFCMRPAGFSEGFSHVYQNLVASAALCTLFAGGSYKRPIGLALRLFAALAVACLFSWAFTSLLVDHLVGFAGMALFIAIGYYGSRKTPPTARQLCGIGAIACGAVLLKTSAVLIVAAAFVFMALLMLAACRRWRAGGFVPEKRRAPVVAATVCAPFALFAAWLLHVQLAFPGQGYAANKFALTLHNFAVQYSSKPQEILDCLPGEFVGTLLGASLTRFFFFALGLAAVAAAVIFAARKKWDVPLLCAIVVSAGLWAAYNTGYYFMLRYLMPGWEMARPGALVLAFERYEGSLVAAVAGFLLFMALQRGRDHGLFPKVWQGLAAGLVFALPLAPYLAFTGFAVPTGTAVYEEFLHIDKVYREVPPVYGPNTHLLFYTGDYYDNTSSYNNHIFTGKYLTNHTANFGNTSLNGVPLKPKDTVLPVFEGAEYLVVAVAHPALFALLDEAGISYDAADGLFYQIAEDKGRYRLVKLR